MSPKAEERVAVQYATVRSGVPAAPTLKRWAGLALAHTSGRVTVRVVGEREGAEFNRRYRNRPRATNVLSFPAAALPDGSQPVLGDVVIAAPVVAREAAAQHKAPRAHWAHLVIHGCLHLLGYDHETGEERRAMEARERKLLAGLGYPDPYEAEAKSR